VIQAGTEAANAHGSGHLPPRSRRCVPASALHGAAVAGECYTFRFPPPRRGAGYLITMTEHSYARAFYSLHIIGRYEL